MDTAASFLGKLPRGRNQDGFKNLLTKLRTYLSDDQVEVAQAAYRCAAAAHEGQRRMSGQPYITHPVAVAAILADLHLDYETIAAALLHDVIEDCAIDKAQLGEQFGVQIADLVDGVSKLDKIKFKSKAEAQAESLRKMMLAMTEDIRVIMVKLADRVHNMRTIGVMRPEKRRRIARETLEIYAPIANRLGINSIRLELEDLGFKSMYPKRYKVIEAALKRARGNQRHVIRKIVADARKAMEAAGVEAEVDGRAKHIYSIYRKMLKKGVPLANIVDVYGCRVVVKDVDLCYRTLGVVHGLYRPMPGRFKDFIAIPRVNGYQALHTTLFGPDGLPLEVQIRTEDMHRIAESGIAAHWLYKADNRAGAAPQERAREWLGSLMDLQAQSDSEEFIENVKVDLFPDKVYVFTPRGDILRLPRGATAVDFAYAVHTDVGNHCVAAKVDRRLVPLRTPLASGQTVEIITAKAARPNPAWMNFVGTAKARTNIRQFLKNLRRNEAVVLGRRLMQNALAEFDLKPRKLDKERLKMTLAELNLDSLDALYTEVGLGRQLAPLLARRLAVAADEMPAAGTEEGTLTIAGTEGMVVTYAKCCYPVPGDTIMGYLSAGRGLVIHRQGCGNLAGYRKQPEKWVTVDWEPEIDGQYCVEIRVEAANQMGVLAAVAANIADSGCNIDHVEVEERDEHTSFITFLLMVQDIGHLNSVVSGIELMPEVLAVNRKST